jgi:hypothetical protein
MTIDSMKEWLASWGDGPNWSDSTGVTIPITKESLRQLIATAERMRTALSGLRERALNYAPGMSQHMFSPAAAVLIAHTCDDALDETTRGSGGEEG